MLKLKTIFLTLLSVCWINAAASDYVIVSPETASLPERTAAGRLAYYLQQMTGQKVDIVSQADSRPAIFVGQSPQIAKMLGDINFAQFKTDEIVLESVGNNLVVTGQRPRGTLYAVYTLLEKFLGCRFWDYEINLIPKQKNLVLNDIHYRYTPPFLRRSLYHWPLPALPALWKSGKPEYAVICRCNADLTASNAIYGGIDSRAGFVHTFRRIMPPKKYFPVHPEYFSLIKGKRVAESQLCFSNQEMRKCFIKCADDYIKKSPDCHSISISQNDNMLFCQCPECKKLLQEEKGRWSGVMLRFVNEVAAELEKKHPGILVETLAYGPTIEPPLVTMPRSNIVVRLAGITTNYGYALNSTENQVYRDLLQRWKAITPHLAVWYYTQNYANVMIPQPTLRHTAEDFRWLKQNGIKDIFIESSGTSNGVSDMNRLRAYVYRRLLWNPGLDMNQLINEFLVGYYGKSSAPYVRSYIETIHSPLDKKITAKELLRRIDAGDYRNDNLKLDLNELKRHPQKMMNPYIGVYINNVSAYLDRKKLLQAAKIMDQAIAAAETPEYEDRLERTRLSIRHALLLDPEIAAHPRKYNFTAKQLQDLVKNTIKTAHRNNAGNWGNSPYPVLASKMQRLHKMKKMVIPPFLKNTSPQDITSFGFSDWAVMVPKKVFQVKDPDAVDGKAWRMINGNPNWALQCHSITTTLSPGIYKLYLRLRLEPKNGRTPGSGTFFNAGYYRPKESYKSQLLRAQVKDFSDGKYHYGYAGTYKIDTTGRYFFCDPCNHPGVKAIVVDQLIAVRQNN